MHKNWKKFERDGVLFSSLEPHMDTLGRISRGKGRYLPSPYLFVGFHKGLLTWLYGQPAFQERSIAWLAGWLKQGVRGLYFREAERIYHNALTLLTPLSKKPLPSSPSALIRLHKKIRAITQAHTRLLVSIDGFDDYFEMASPDLLVPAYRSAVMEYERSLLTIAIKAKTTGLDACKRDIARIESAYLWLPMGWGATLPLSTEQIAREVTERMRHATAKLRKELQRIAHYPETIKRKRKEILKRRHISKHSVSQHFAILDRFARLHDERKEVQMRCIFATDRIRRAVASQYGLLYKDLTWLTGDELDTAIRTGKLPQIDGRKIGYSYYAANGKILIHEGGRAVRDIELATKAKIADAAELRGVPASPGKAEGRAVVASGAAEAIQKIKKGDILVCSMTTPDFVPAMKKAAAVVTNEGGITSHAAIICRELGIPAIIGTLHGTTWIKTGERVEVDAEKGVIRKVRGLS